MFISKQNLVLLTLVLLTGIALSIPVYVLIGVSNVKIFIASILSLAIAGFLSIYLTIFLKNAYQFSLALFTSLLVSAIVDGFFYEQLLFYV